MAVYDHMVQNLFVREGLPKLHLIVHHDYWCELCKERHVDYDVNFKRCLLHQLTHANVFREVLECLDEEAWQQYKAKMQEKKQ